MKNGITRQPLGITIVLFTLLLLFFWGRHITGPLPAEAAVPNLTPFGSVVSSWFAGLEWLEAVVSVFVVFLTAIVVTRLVSRNLVFPARTYVFLIFFAIVGYGVFIRTGNLPAVLAGYLLARASECFASAFRRSARMIDSFRGALLLGIAPLFYAPAAMYMLLLPLAMPVYMRGGRETVVGFVGLAFPMLAYAYVMWALGEPFTGYFTDLYGQLSAPGDGLPFIDMATPAGIARMLLMALVAAGLVMSLGTYIMNAGMIRTRAFRIYLFMIFFMLAGIGGLLLPCASAGDLPLLALPVSVVASEYFSRYTGTVASLIYISTIVVAVAYNILLIV